MSDQPRIETVAIATIQPYENNPRSRTKAQIRALADSIKRNGFNTPIVVDEDNVIINGHGRYAAALFLKLETVPIIRVSHLTEAEMRAYRIADNKIAAMSAWDIDLLPAELQAIRDADLGLDSTGFEVGEIDFLMDQDAEAKGQEIAEEDALPELKPTVVTKPGQLWTLGDHRILCGDARDPAALAKLMAGEQARMVFTDPPYNVKIDGFAVGAGATRHEEFAMASGEMSPEEFAAFLQVVLVNMRDCCRDGAILFVCMDWRHLDELSFAARNADLAWLNMIVWVKSNAGMGTFYRSRHELVLVYKKGAAAHVNTFGLGEGGRHRSNVWEYRGANAFSATRADDLASHPTVKPARMVADAIKDVSGRGDIVLDAFGGSGTTLLAAQMTGRHARLLEISPAYVDLTIRRWQKATGKAAVDAVTGRTFEDYEANLAPLAVQQAAAAASGEISSTEAA